MPKKWLSVRIDEDLFARLPTGRGEASAEIRKALRFYLDMKDRPSMGKPPTEAELRTMREQVMQTQAIGRNLNQLIREWYAIREGKDSTIELVEWENLHRLIAEVAADMQKIIAYWGRK